MILIDTIYEIDYRKMIVAAFLFFFTDTGAANSTASIRE